MTLFAFVISHINCSENLHVSTCGPNQEAHGTGEAEAGELQEIPGQTKQKCKTLFQKKILYRAWRDVSAIKSTCRYCKGPRFISQDPLSNS